MRLTAIIHKEFLHILRDSRTLTLVLLMPLVMIFLYGWAINLDVKHIKIGVVDLENSPESRALIRRFSESGYFEIKYYLKHSNEFEALFRKGSIKGGLTIPADFSRSIAHNFSTPIQLVVDGSDGNTAQTMLNYARSIVAQYNTDLLPAGMKVPMEITPRFWYNPAMESADFIVPGLAAVILMMISALMTSISIVREKETGTLEQVLVSPIHVVETIAGKVIPYIGLALIDGLLTIGIGLIIFGVPFVGSPLLLLMNTVIYLYAALALGLFISTLANTQQNAMAAALLATLLPSMMLSGFVFPIASMPVALQWLSKIIPATYYLKIIRGILLKGTDMSTLYPNTLILLGIGTLFLVFAVRKFKVKLG